MIHRRTDTLSGKKERLNHHAAFSPRSGDTGITAPAGGPRAGGGPCGPGGRARPEAARAHPAEPEAPPAPAHTRRRPDVCAPASPADLKRRVPFTVFAPRALPAGWVPAVCAYPPGSRRVYGLRIQFRAAWTALPPAGILGDRIAGIAQTKAYLAQLTDKHGEPVPAARPDRAVRALAARRPRRNRPRLSRRRPALDRAGHADRDRQPFPDAGSR